MSAEQHPSLIVVDVTVDEGVDIAPDALVADAEAALRGLGLLNAELSLVLTDDPRIAALNGQWRNKPEPTDVLSFPQRDAGAPATGASDLLGDVVISVNTAARQAAELGHSLETELRVLLVHGLCHLLGHDHLTDEERREMQALEGRILGMLAHDVAPPSLIARAHADDV